jgi:hypothetical protein
MTRGPLFAGQAAISATCAVVAHFDAETLDDLSLPRRLTDLA